MHVEVALHGGKRDAVIGGRDDQGLLRQPGGFERAQDVPYARIERSGAGMKGGHVLPCAQRVGDRRRRLRKACIILRARNVKDAVGFEESDIQKKRLPGSVLQEFDRHRRHVGYFGAGRREHAIVADHLRPLGDVLDAGEG